MSRLDADGLAAALPPDVVEGREFGKYHLTRRLARGGMGEVYLARLVGELGFEKQLVIKTILPELAEKPRFIEMFAAEAKTAVALSHGNIVPAYELGRAAETFYIAMGYVDGPSVAQLLEAAVALDRAPDVATGLHVVRGVLAGLSYAHREEPGRPAVVHRDITPRNVLIDRSGQVRIVDFGIAAPARRQVGIRAGSIGYMSPEQARGDAADPRADVFSVGCMLYELCTHTRAFPKESVWSMPDLSTLPDEVRGPVERALAIDPDARFEDASAMNAALRAAFTKYAATYDDATLARAIAELFPSGWRRDDEDAPGSSGARPVLAGPSETYATRLTAITGIDVSAMEFADVDPTESRPSMHESTGPRGALEGETERVPASAPAESSRDRGVRVSSLAVVLGALAIGVAAFAIGRTESRADRSAGAGPPPSDVERSAGPVAAREPSPASPDDAAVRLAASEAPGSPPRARPRSLTRHLEVEPEGARVTVDGTPLEGPSPYELSVPAEGTVEVTVWAKGHRAETFSLSGEDASGAAEPHAVVLDPVPAKPREPGDLRVLAPTVAWGEVRVDGKKVGNTPTRRISLLAGRHKVEVLCVPDVCNPARTLYKQTVTIEPGKLTRVDAR